MEDDAQLYKKFSKKALNKYLICTLCEGYFRFAHTIAECGHTFCKICIYNYMKNEKGKMSKCPHCHALLDADLKKTIKKDPYKQQLVDIMHPNFSSQENVVIARVRELFPTVDLEFLLDEFNYDYLTSFSSSRKKKKTNDAPQQYLPEIVNHYLKMDFDQFVDQIYDEKKFQEMKKVLQINNPVATSQPIQNKAPEQKVQDTTTKPVVQSEDDSIIMFYLNPYKDVDFNIVKLKNVLRLKNQDKQADIEHVKRFIMKRILESYDKNNNQNSLIDINQANLENIYIYYEEELIPNDKTTLTQLKIRHNNPETHFTLKYEIKFKK